MLPSNDPDSVLVNAFCCFDPSQEPNHIQRFAETLCERFWHAFKSNKFQPNLRFDSAACQKEIVSAQLPHGAFQCLDVCRSGLHFMPSSVFLRSIVGATETAAWSPDRCGSPGVRPSSWRGQRQRSPTGQPHRSPVGRSA